MAATPQPSPVERGEPVSPEVLAFLNRCTSINDDERGALKELIIQRCEYGMSKYGQLLMTKDGRDDVIDALQELGDLLQYAMKARMNGRQAELAAAVMPGIRALTALLANEVS